MQVQSFGCRLNLAEGEAIARFAAHDPLLRVVNTCAVTNEALRQSRQAIRRMRRVDPDARIVVTGCAVETDREALAAMPEIDQLIPNVRKGDAAAYGLASATPGGELARTRAFIAVQNGCDYRCTFCVIPQGRGASRSLVIADVIRSANQALDGGAGEIVLTGVDIASWGADLETGQRLGDLCRALLDAIPRLQRLRLSSLDPAAIDPALIDLIVGEPRLMPHLHFSFQHGDPLILKRMRRRHSREQALTLVERLRQCRPDLAIGADLIAGFPTETEDMHANNLSLVAEGRIVHGHVFPYSARTGTPAARMPQVEAATIKRRAAELREAVAHERSAWLASRTGIAAEVLVERDGTGHSPDFARYRAPQGVSPGAVIALKASAVQDGMLIGELA